jgi:hypothetical protein
MVVSFESRQLRFLAVTEFIPEVSPGIRSKSAAFIGTGLPHLGATTGFLAIEVLPGTARKLPALDALCGFGYTEGLNFRGKMR